MELTVVVNQALEQITLHFIVLFGIGVAIFYLYPHPKSKTVGFHLSVFSMAVAFLVCLVYFARKLP